MPTRGMEQAAGRRAADRPALTGRAAGDRESAGWAVLDDPFVRRVATLREELAGLRAGAEERASDRADLVAQALARVDDALEELAAVEEELREQNTTLVAAQAARDMVALREERGRRRSRSGVPWIPRRSSPARGESRTRRGRP